MSSDSSDTINTIDQGFSDASESQLCQEIDAILFRSHIPGATKGGPSDGDRSEPHQGREGHDKYDDQQLDCSASGVIGMFSCMAQWFS